MAELAYPEARRAPVAAASLRNAASVRRRELSWTGTVVLFVLVVWLIPIKSYKLPLKLPFNLELYRLVILLLFVAWLISLVHGAARLRAGGRGRVMLLLAVGAVLALATNLSGVDAAGIQTQALKSLSFFLSYLLAFMLISSVVERVDEVVRVLRAVAIGAAIVAVAALYESRTHHNLFDHLQSLPFLVHFGRENQNVNGGALRVRASAQHPIALGCALAMCVPIALHLSTRASSVRRRRVWLVLSAVILMGAMATISRTVILMLVAMVICSFVLYGRSLLRYWPLLIVLAGITHFAAPGVVSHLYKRFNPKGGLVSQLDSRPGLRGSGRLADLGPGLGYWSGSPLFGHGLGTVAATGDSLAVTSTTQIEGPPIIFDDQYMNTLVSLGLVGIVGVIGLVWGSALRMGRLARRSTGADGALLAACTIAVVGFGAGMATFDAFTFVQSTLVFITILALGLRVRALLSE